MKSDAIRPHIFFHRFFLLFIAVFFTGQPAMAGQAAQNIDLSVSFDFENHRINGVSRFEMAPEQSIVLQVGGLDIRSVSVDGIPEQLAGGDDGLLAIPSAATSRKVAVVYAKTIVQEQNHSRSLIDQEGIVLLDLWYPLPTEEVVVSLTAEIPASFFAISEADEIQYQQSKNGKKVSFSFPYATSFVHFIAGPYQVEEEILPDGTLLSTYFFPEDEKFAKLYGAKTKEYLARYVELIGPYPYKRFSVVENRLPTGFAMPTFTLLGQSVVRLPFIVETSLGHEVLHSWFGNGVDVDSQQGNWCEGLTTYLADQAYAADKNEDVAFRKGQLVKYESHVAADSTMTVADFKGAGDHGAASRSSRAVGYNKVSMIFHMLHKQLGDDAFYAALRDFYTAHKYSKAGWSDIRESFEKVSGENLEIFFEQWLTRADLPRLGVQGLDLEIEDGEVNLTFNITQANDPAYQLLVPLKIQVGDDVVVKEITVDGSTTPVSLSFAEIPQTLVIDPDYDLMRELVEDELPPVWSRFQGSAEKLAVLEEGREDYFASFVEALKAMDCVVVSEEELDEKEIGDKDVVFLGMGSKAGRAHFGTPELPAAGFVLDVRKNPLNPSRIAVLVETEDASQVEPAIGKLRHYGKYGYLFFQNGRIKEKNIPATESGQIYLLDRPLRGVAVEKSRSFAEIMDDVSLSRVIYVGETHVNQADHLLQYRVIEATYKRYPDIAIGMEMFNRTIQDVLDAYVGGELTEQEFLKKSHYFKHWGYDYGFYRDILQFAKKHKLPVVALNIDKEIVSNTFKNGGIAALDPEVQEGLPQERDLAMPGYRKRLSQVFKQHSGPHFNDDKISTFVQAQTLWDETMAETVADFLKANAETKMVVIAGSGHVVKENAIPPRVARRIPVQQSVLVTVKEGDLAPDEADYVFFSPPVRRPESPKIGVMLEEKDEGVTIVGLSPHGAAKKARLAKDDIILAIDDQEVKTVEDLKISLVYKEKGQTITVKVLRPVFILPDAVLDFEVIL